LMLSTRHELLATTSRGSFTNASPFMALRRH
jgi:hypothetical protein